MFMVNPLAADVSHRFAQKLIDTSVSRLFEMFLGEFGGDILIYLIFSPKLIEFHLFDLNVAHLAQYRPASEVVGRDSKIGGEFVAPHPCTLKREVGGCFGFIDAFGLDD